MKVGAPVFTYKFDVVLLIQQEVFYLQIPVRQRAGKRLNICTVFLFTLDNVSNRQQSYNANAGEVNPQRGPPHTQTPLPMWVTLADFSGSIVCPQIPPQSQKSCYTVIYAGHLAVIEI